MVGVLKFLVNQLVKFGLIWLIVLKYMAYFLIVVLVIRVLIKYIQTPSVSNETKVLRKSLGETIKDYRTDNHMTQEFVAEALTGKQYQNGKMVLQNPAQVIYWH